VGDTGTFEAELMRRWCDGDAAAFRALYDRLAPRVLAYVATIVRDRAAAEDVLQQAFLKLHLSRASYVRDANPVPWLYTIANRCALDEVRRRKRARVKLTADGELPREPRASLAGDPVERTPAPERDDARTVTMADLDGLPHNQREALLLTKVHGHSIADAALIAGTTPGAIKLRAHRAYETLRKRLASKAPAARSRQEETA
jgi:RNA polymerase sigma-70 factor (ECF subfamily)